MRSRADRDDRRGRHRWWWSAGPPQVYLLDGRTDVAAGYSFRALSTTYSGPVIRARRSSDNAELDFPALYGFLDFPSISSWAGGDAFATTFYDQSGRGRHLVQSTAANQPQIIQAGNSHPTLLFDGTNDAMQTAAFALNQPLSYNIVYRRVTNGATQRYVFDGLTGASVVLYRDASVPVDNRMYAGASTLMSDDAISMGVGVRGAVGGAFNGASSRLEVNGSTIASFTGDVGAQNMDGLTVGTNGALTAARFSNIEVQELALFSSSHTQTQLKADNAAMRAAWGF